MEGAIHQTKCTTKLIEIDESLFEIATTADATNSNGHVISLGRTNHLAVRSMHPMAKAWKVKRVNKMLNGSRRQMVMVSVIDSFRYYVNECNLEGIINEFLVWGKEGMNCCEEELKALTKL